MPGKSPWISGASPPGLDPARQEVPEVAPPRALGTRNVDGAADDGHTRIVEDTSRRQRLVKPAPPVALGIIDESDVVPEVGRTGAGQRSGHAADQDRVAAGKCARLPARHRKRGRRLRLPPIAGWIAAPGLPQPPPLPCIRERETAEDVEAFAQHGTRRPAAPRAGDRGAPLPARRRLRQVEDLRVRADRGAAVSPGARVVLVASDDDEPLLDTPDRHVGAGHSEARAGSPAGRLVCAVQPKAVRERAVTVSGSLTGPGVLFP